MVTAKVDHGLCMTCNNGPTCHYRAVRGPAVFCEMFDNYASPIDAGSCGEPSGCSEPPSALCATEEKDNTYAGLCLTGDGEALISYYSGHGYANGTFLDGDNLQRCAIYLARLEL